MIRRGRKEGWLKRPIETLSTWAEFNGVKFNGIKIGPMPNLEHRGSTVIATRELSGGREEPLVIVPKDLVISRANVDVYAKSDQHLKQVLEAVGDFGRVSRSKEQLRTVRLTLVRPPAAPYSSFYYYKPPSLVLRSRALAYLTHYQNTSNFYRTSCFQRSGLKRNKIF
jgi:hypothetical protein